MRLQAPYPQVPALEGERTPLSRSWLDWLRTVWQILGQDNLTPVYEDLYCDIDDPGTLATLNGGVACPEMATGADTAFHFRARLPNRYKDGTTLTPFFEFAPDDALAGNALLEFGYSTGGNGDAMAAETTEQSTEAMAGVALENSRVSFSAIGGTNLRKGDIIAGKIERVGTDGADTYGGSLLVLAVGFKMQVEGIGWETANP